MDEEFGPVRNPEYGIAQLAVGAELVENQGRLQVETLRGRIKRVQLAQSSVEDQNGQPSAVLLGRQLVIIHSQSGLFERCSFACAQVSIMSLSSN